MEIVIGADHRGFKLKQGLLAWLKSQGHEVTDVGATEHQDEDDYPVYALKVAQAIREDSEHRRGIVICGSGAGMAVAANKVKGVRAALVSDPKIAAAASNDDNVNVIALGADYVTADVAQEIIAAWLNTPFSGEDRHQRRIEQIAEYEHEHGCRCTTCK